MVKDHSDSEKGNPLPPHRLLLSINSKGSFICTIPDRIAHTMAFVTPVVEHWLEREIVQWVPPWRIDPTTHRTMSEHSYHGAVTRITSSSVVLHELSKHGVQFIVLNQSILPHSQHLQHERQLLLVNRGNKYIFSKYLGTFYSQEGF